MLSQESVTDISLLFQGKFAKFKKYPGHSAHVTNVRWTHDGRKLVSTGGADTAVMVWARQSAQEKGRVQGESDDSDTDSEEEGKVLVQCVLYVGVGGGERGELH